MSGLHEIYFEVFTVNGDANRFDESDIHLDIEDFTDFLF